MKPMELWPEYVVLLSVMGTAGLGVLLGEGLACLDTLGRFSRWPWELRQEDGTILGARRYGAALVLKVLCYSIIAVGIYVLSADPMHQILIRALVTGPAFYGFGIQAIVSQINRIIRPPRPPTSPSTINTTTSRGRCVGCRPLVSAMLNAGIGRSQRPHGWRSCRASPTSRTSLVKRRSSSWFRLSFRC